MSAAARWNRLSLRTRLVIGSSVPLALAVLVGTVALAAIFAAGRVAEVDRQTAAESRVLSQLVSSGQLPAPLPVPAGSSLLAQVLGSDGVLASSASASRLLPLATMGTGIRTIEDPATGQVPIRVRVVTSNYEGRPVTVVVGAPLGDVRRATRALRIVLLVVAPLLVLLATLLTRLLVGRALRPVERLRQSAVGLLAERALTGRLLALPPHEDELHRLATTFNDVLTRLNRSVEQQREFVASAAHELRSPLASLRVQLDVATRHPGLVDSPEFIADLSAEADRLAQLADDLLLLARLDASPAIDTAAFDLAQLADAPSHPVLVHGDETALRRMHRNLVDNARRHAAHAETSVYAEGAYAVLDVDDDGPGIPVADRRRVFDRWVRLDEDRGRAGGGAGLGLAIVREIAATHGGEVDIFESPLGGARLRVRLPLSP